MSAEAKSGAAEQQQRSNSAGKNSNNNSRVSPKLTNKDKVHTYLHYTIEEGNEEEEEERHETDGRNRIGNGDAILRNSNNQHQNSSASHFSGDRSIILPDPPNRRVPDQTYLFERSLTLSSGNSAISASSGGSGSHRVTLETSLKKEAAERAKAKEAMQRENPPVYLCCSQQEPEDYQVDLCPRSWFNLSEANGCLDATWKLIVLCCCLPMCYPCYLTKRCRRKTKRVLEPSVMSDGNRPSSPLPHKVFVIKATRSEDSNGDVSRSHQNNNADT